MSYIDHYNKISKLVKKSSREINNLSSYDRDL